MSAMSGIVAIIAVLGALLLAWRGLRSHRLEGSRMIRFAVIWLAIIGGLVLLLWLAGA